MCFCYCCPVRFIFVYAGGVVGWLRYLGYSEDGQSGHWCIFFVGIGRVVFVRFDVCFFGVC